MALSRITAASIADGTVVAADIADGAITTAKIADGNVTAAKVSTIANTQLTGTITTAQLGTGSVSNTKIASGAVEQYFADTGYETQFRNRIFNGAMEIDQRNAGANTVVSSNAPYTVDRFRAQISQHNGSMNVRQDSTSTTGFVKSLRAIVTTANTSLPATSVTRLWTNIEGTTVADLGWGTADAKTVTLSFYARSSNTGTFSGAVTNYDENRSYPFSYTINSADTFERKTITIPGDTTGNWSSNTNGSIAVNFDLGSGSTQLGTADAWVGSWKTGVTGSFSLIGVLNATFYITGVQLEVGSVATPFERRPYGTELSLCQRYYEKSFNTNVVPGASAPGAQLAYCPGNVNRVYGTIVCRVTKRAAATYTIYSTAGATGQMRDATAGVDIAASLTTTAGENGVGIASTAGISAVSNQIQFHYTASAEL